MNYELRIMNYGLIVNYDVKPEEFLKFIIHDS